MKNENDRRQEAAYPGNYADKSHKEKSEESSENSTIRPQSIGSFCGTVYAPPEWMGISKDEDDSRTIESSCGIVYAPPERMGFRRKDVDDSRTTGGSCGEVYAPPKFMDLDDSGDDSDE